MSRRVIHDGGGAFQIRFPFDRGLVDQVKALPQRRWIATERFWQVPEGDVLELVELLADQRFQFDETTRELYAASGGTRELDGVAVVAPAPRSRGLFDTDEVADEDGTVPSGALAPGDYTVVSLNERVSDVLGAAFPGNVWLVGEIAGFNKAAHRRHVGFELVERDEDGRALSKVSATLFDRTRQEIERRLERAGGPFRLEDEIRVRVAARVELYVPWGSYRVIVEDVDLDYTLGEAARRREEILRRLADAGLTGVNDALPLPPLPLRVGLITSLDSDAYNDVLRTLQESGFAFRVIAHGARVQGRATEPSVLNALDALRKRAAELDVVLICRGGGSRTDLVWFDSEKLGRAVATFPLPVIVGIGHEQDRSVLDGVARSRKTPTATAALLVESARGALERIEEARSRLLELARRRVGDERRRAAERGHRLAAGTRSLLRNESERLIERRRRAALGARRHLDRTRERLERIAAALPREAGSRLAERRRTLTAAVRSMVHGARRELESARRSVATLEGALSPRSRRRVERERERIDGREQRLRSVDPRRVVERGYAILRQRGRVVTRAADAPRGGRLQAELRDGTLELTSEGALPPGDERGDREG